MMMMGDRKKTIAAILGPQENEHEEKEEGKPINAMMKEFIDAVHAKDHDQAAEIFKALHTEADSGAPDIVEASSGE